MTNGNRRRTIPGQEDADSAQAGARMSLREIEAFRRHALDDIVASLTEAERRAGELDEMLRANGRPAEADELDDLVGYLQLAQEAREDLSS